MIIVYKRVSQVWLEQLYANRMVGSHRLICRVLVLGNLPDCQLPNQARALLFQPVQVYGTVECGRLLMVWSKLAVVVSWSAEG